MTPRVGWRPRQAERYAQKIGCEVDYHGGEVRFTYPGLPSVRMNRRRNDLPRPVILFLRRVTRPRAEVPVKPKAKSKKFGTLLGEFKEGGKTVKVYRIGNQI